MPIFFHRVQILFSSLSTFNTYTLYNKHTLWSQRDSSRIKNYIPIHTYNEIQGKNGILCKKKVTTRSIYFLLHMKRDKHEQ